MQKHKKAEKAQLIDFPAIPEAAANPAPAPAAQKKDLKYLWLYALGIFSVAIVLMLLSFLSQSQKAGELAQQQHLDFSASALKSIEAMKDENDSLRGENADLNLTKNALISQVGELQQQLDALLESNDQLRGRLTDAEGLLEQYARDYQELLTKYDLILGQLEEDAG